MLLVKILIFKFRSANVQADLNLRWAHMSKSTFSDIADHMFIASRLPRNTEAAKICYERASCTALLS